MSPDTFWTDRDLVAGRWLTDPSMAFGAWIEDHLAACRRLATDEGLTRIVACVNASRPKAYRQLLSMGFRAERNGVTMHRPNEDGYNQTAAYILDDWR
jgi:hypothetical protein